MSDNGDERQLVVFELAEEAYGVSIGSVREIIRLQEITHVPNAPGFVEGVINLRSRIIPVVDLRRRFRLAEAERTRESRIVVVDIRGEDIGLLVDSVREVLRIADEIVEPASSLVTTDDSVFIQGIANLGERLVILLDLEKCIPGQELGQFAAAAA